MLESKFQKDLIKKLKTLFVGCMVMKTDPTYIQGIPDILILYKDRWAALELKKHAKAHRQPNQEYYTNLMNNMSFCRFIYPENEEEVVNDLKQAFKS